MRISRVLGISLIAVAASIALPPILSAQDEPERQPPVRVTLLESGEIQLTGAFLLETANRDIRFLGTDVTVDEESIEILNGIAVESEAFVLRADTAKVSRDGDVIQMQGARISLNR